MRRSMLLAALLATSVACGQGRVLKGVLTDFAGVGIAYATVSLSAGSLNKEMIDYTVTDADGNWRIESTGANGKYLTFGRLGYESETVPTSLCDAVRLRLCQNDIDEIVVRSRSLGVKAKQDTLVYSPNSFKTGDEANLGDVIGKLHGLSVKEGGKVSFNGKDIDKILINGKDIIQSSGTAALSTLSADFAQSVELLQNYSTNNVTTSFESDNAMALDIKTDAGGLTGSIALGGGLKNKCEMKASLLSIGADVSKSFIANANNTGEPVFSVMDYLRSFGCISGKGGGVRTIGVSDEMSRVLMPSQNRYKSASGIVNANFDFSKSDSFKAQLMLLGNMSCDNARDRQCTDYVDVGARSLSSVEDVKSNMFATSMLSLEWNPRETHSIKSATLFRTNRSHGNTNAVRSSAGSTDSLAHSERVGNVYFQESLTSNKLIKAGLLATRVDLSLGLNGNRVTSSADKDRHEFRAEALVDASYKHPLFSSSVFFSNTLSADSHFESYSVDESEYVSGCSFAYGMGLMRNKGVVQFEVGVSLRNIRAMPRLIGSTLHLGLWRFEPKASLKLKFSNQHELSVSCNANTGLSDIAKLSRSSWVKEYDKTVSPSEVSEMKRSRQSLSLNYFLMNLYSRTTLL